MAGVSRAGIPEQVAIGVGVAERGVNFGSKYFKDYPRRNYSSF
jgi:hypothetical protein